jgi:hypothetical protein
MKQLFVKGTNIQITGVKQLVPCCAYIHGFDAEGEPDFGDESEMFYNDQKDDIGVDGGKIYMDDHKAEYRMDELEFRDVPDDGDGE